MLKKISYLMLIGLTACNNFSKNEYIYFPPETTEARACITNCKHERETCENAANKAYQECLREAERSSMLNYTIDLNNHHSTNATQMRTLEECKIYSKTCERDYNICYVNCGGKVESNSYLALSA